MKEYSRRDFLKFAGAAVAGTALVAVRPLEALAQVGDPIRNTEINSAQPGEWIHPMKEGEPWDYSSAIRIPGLPNAGVFSGEGLGKLKLTGTSDVGIDVLTNPNYMRAHIGENGATAAIWVRNAAFGDRLVLLNENNQPVGAVNVGQDGFAGILYPEDSLSNAHQFGLRIVRTPGTAGVIDLEFGSISKEDFADPVKRNHPSVIDAQNPSIAANVLPAAAVVEQTPAQSVEGTPIARIDKAPKDVFFQPEGWSRAVQLMIPSWNQGVVYSSAGVGQLNARTIAEMGGKEVILVLRCDPKFMTDYQEGRPENRPAMWAHITPVRAGDPTQEGSQIQLLDQNLNPITLPIAGVTARAAIAVVDGNGFGGVVLPPTEPAIIKLRFLPQRPEFSVNVGLNFGAERPEDRGKSSTLVTTDYSGYIPKS